MKKLLFVFTLAAFCTLSASSFKPAQTVANNTKQIVLATDINSVTSYGNIKKDKKATKKDQAPACCQQKAKKADCPYAQCQNCQALKCKCPQVKNCPKK